MNLKMFCNPKLIIHIDFCCRSYFSKKKKKGKEVSQNIHRRTMCVAQRIKLEDACQSVVLIESI